MEDCRSVQHTGTSRLANRTNFMLLFFFILVINQLDAQNLFCNKFISCLYMFRAPCARRQEVKIVLYSLWYHHTETSEWSKITKITKITWIYKYEIQVILVILVISDHSLVSVWWYQRLYNTILISWRWAHGARIYKYEILVILVILVILDHSLVSVWWYQRLYNTIFDLLTMST